MTPQGLSWGLLWPPTDGIHSMASYTPQELQAALKLAGTRFYAVKILEDDSTDFLVGFQDFGSAAKFGGTPDYHVAVVNDDGSHFVVRRTDPDFYDFGKTRVVPQGDDDNEEEEEQQ